MGELIFPSFKKIETTETKSETVDKVDFSSIEEKNAISETLLRERYDFILTLKRNNLSLRNTEPYKNAYNLLANSSRVSIANMMNNASEIEIKMKPAYYIAAFDILCE